MIVVYFYSLVHFVVGIWLLVHMARIGLASLSPCLHGWACDPSQANENIFIL